MRRTHRLLVLTGYLLLGSAAGADARQLPTIPIVVEDVRVVPPERDGLVPELAITVRNTGALTIEAWGVSGEVRYSNGVVRPVGVSTDTYETPFLPQHLRPPSAQNKRLVSGGRATIRTSVPSVPLAEPLDGSAVPTFAVFEDDTAVGDETKIDFVFTRRRVAQRAWRLADEAVAGASGRGLSDSQVLATLADAINAADTEIQQSIPFSIIRRILAAKPSDTQLQRLREEIVSRRAATDRHVERRY